MSEDYQAPPGAEHPITPPQWQVDAWCRQALAMGADVDAVFLKAARWGGDQELEACVSYVDNNVSGNKARALRAARRPKPPSLSEPALQALVHLDKTAESQMDTTEAVYTIRRALERLQELEGVNG